MSRFDHLREQIDACRAGSGDLALPALAELSQAIGRDEDVAAEVARSQDFDKAIGAALVDVPVPAGLVDRLLAATAETALAESPAATELPAVRSAEVTVLPTKRRWQRPSRRQLLAGGTVALGVAIALMALYRGLRPDTLVSEQELGGAVAGWLTQLQADAWQPPDVGNYPPGIRPDTAVRTAPRQWQTLHISYPTGWSAKVTALDLASPGRPQAVLFVVRSSARFDVPPIPIPTKGLGLSRRIKAIAWQRVDSPWLYVLAVEEIQDQKLHDYVQERNLTVHERPASGHSL